MWVVNVCYDMHSLVVSNLRLLIKRVLSEPGKVGQPRTECVVLSVP